VFFKKRLGAEGEETAADYLTRRGVRLLARNFKCPAGEIDLIGLDGSAIVFFEVKTRRSDAAADPENNIGPSKRQRMLRTARWWLTKHHQPQAPYRFDAISVVLPDAGAPRVRHIVDAFRPRKG
jgi:putative endonuclease